MVRSVPEQDGPPRKRWTRTECELLEKSGIWDGRRFELVDGEVYDKHGSTRAHTIALTLVRSWLRAVSATSASIRERVLTWRRRIIQPAMVASGVIAKPFSVNELFDHPAL